MCFSAKAFGGERVSTMKKMTFFLQLFFLSGALLLSSVRAETQPSKEVVGLECKSEEIWTTSPYPPFDSTSPSIREIWTRAVKIKRAKESDTYQLILSSYWRYSPNPKSSVPLTMEQTIDLLDRNKAQNPLKNRTIAENLRCQFDGIKTRCSAPTSNGFIPLFSSFIQEGAFENRGASRFLAKRINGPSVQFIFSQRSAQLDRINTAFDGIFSNGFHVRNCHSIDKRSGPIPEN